MVATLKIVIGVIVVAVCVTALVVGIVLGTRNNNKCDSAVAPTSLSFTQTNYNVRVSWQDPERSDDCESIYRFGYDLDGVSQATRNTSALSYTLENLGPCTTLTVHIFTISESGELSEGHLMGDYILVPQVITPPSNVEFGVVEESFTIYWQTPKELSKCVGLTYVVEVETDKTDIEPIGGTTENNSYTIAYDAFCLQADISITTVYNSRVSDPFEWLYEDPEDILNIQISEPIEGSDELTVSWSNHPKETACSISYTVHHRVNDEDTQLIPDEETPLEAVIRYEVCEEAFIVMTIQTDDATREIIEDVTQYPKREDLGAVAGVVLQLDSVENKRTLAWTAKVVEHCVITYTIEFTTDVGDDVWEFSTSDSTYEIPEEIYCYNLGANVYPVINEESENRIVGEAGVLESRGLEIFAVDGLDYTSVSEAVTVTWNPHPKVELCSLLYEVQYTYLGEKITVKEISEPTATIPVSVDVCVGTDISVTTYNAANPTWVSLPGVISVTPLTPDEITPPTNIEFEIKGENLEISWATPENLINCADLTFNIEIETGKDPITDTVTGNTYTIRTDDFCFSADVSITTVLSGVSGSVGQRTYTPPQEDLNIVISERVEGSNELTVTWISHPKETACSISYTVYHRVNGEEIELTTTEGALQAIFPYEFCEEAYIRIIIQTEDGTTQEILEEVTQYPSSDDVGIVTNLIMQLEPDENRRSLVWDAKNIGRCAITYAIEFTTDLAAEPLEYSSVNPTYEVPEDIYCYNLAANVHAVINAESANPIVGETGELGSRGYELYAVQNLESQYSSNVLTLRWNEHPKVETCSLRYGVQYTYDGVSSAVLEALEPTITIPIELELCADATVSVTTFNTDNPTWTSAATEDTVTQLPEDLGAVTEIQLNTESGEIRWNAVTGTGRCSSIQYKIDFNLEDGSTITRFTADIVYTIPTEVTYCFSLSIAITPMIGDTEGEVTPQVFTENIMPAVSDLDYTVSPSGQLIVNWTPHPKEDTCGLQYRVTYDVNGKTPDSKEESSTSISFDYVYCGVATLSIVPFDGDDNVGTSDEKNVTPEGPEANFATSSTATIEIVDDTNTQGVLYWTPVVIGDCDPTYDVVVTTTASPTTYQDVEPPFEFLIGDYCLTLQATVTPNINGVSGAPIISDIKNFEMEAVTNLQQELVSDELRITWDEHPKETLCSLTYQVHYFIGDDLHAADVTIDEGTSYTFPYAYCGVDARVVVKPVRGDYLGSEAIVYIPDLEITEISQTVPSVTITSGDPLPTVQWPLMEIGVCNVEYQIEITSLPLNTIIYPSVLTPYEIQDSDYCFDVRAGIALRVGDVTGAYSYSTLIIDIEDPENIEFEVASDTILRATWTPHPKLTRCGMSYQLSYSYGTVSSEPDANGATVELPIAYCTTATLDVTAVSSTGTTSGTTTAMHEQGPPTSVGKVTNINADVSANGDAYDATIKWNAPDYASECTDIVYTVTAVSANGEQTATDDCTITDPCILTLDDFCDATITVVAFSISGDPETYTHECSPESIL